MCFFYLGYPIFPNCFLCGVHYTNYLVGVIFCVVARLGLYVFFFSTIVRRSCASYDCVCLGFSVPNWCIITCSCYYRFLVIFVIIHVHGFCRIGLVVCLQLVGSIFMLFFTPPFGFFPRGLRNTGTFFPFLTIFRRLGVFGLGCHYPEIHMVSCGQAVCPQFFPFRNMPIM